MQKKTKLGIAATSLAAAATVMTPGSAAASDHAFCDPKFCPDPGVDAFLKIEDTFHKIEGFAEPLAAELARVFVKLEDVFFKIE